MMTKYIKPFHVLTVGMDFCLIDNLWARIQAATGFSFSHILEPSIDQRVMATRPDTSHCFFLRDNVRMKMPTPEKWRLAALEQPGVPTIHNMIMSDRVIRDLPYTESLAYATYLVRRLEDLFRNIKPSVIISGFDGLHSGISMALARKLGIPWFALHFSTIPQGLSGFCTGMTPDTSFAAPPQPPEMLQSLAERTLREFETRSMVVPAYHSANSVAMIIDRLPKHIRVYWAAVDRATTRRFDKYTQFSARRLAMQYLRKRLNMLFLPKSWFIEAPPPTPYLFIGLHMQPESSIDVWAPFYSDQFSVIEAIARSTPPTHHLLVKLHKSDAQLDRLRQLPGVRLVSAHALSRAFIENASLVLAIQGTIALEAAMLGCPVLVFGDTKFMEFPSVSKVNRITDLPAQIRGKLSEERPPRERIVRGLTKYLSCYAPGCYNNWEVTLSEEEVETLTNQVQALRSFVEESGQYSE